MNNINRAGCEHIARKATADPGDPLAYDVLQLLGLIKEQHDLIVDYANQFPHEDYAVSPCAAGEQHLRDFNEGYEAKT